MKSQHTYFEGMNQDSSKEKYKNSQYYSMKNFRVLTNEGLSSGAIENEKGHKFSFRVPDLPEMELDNGDIIPAQSNLRIIGWGNINDTIVIFTTNETGPTPNNSYGQIWSLIWNEATGEVVDITGSGELDPTIHLKYNNILNFSSYHRIGRVVGRYETTNKQRVYWTDNYNPVRAFNIADPDGMAIDPENLDLKPSIDFSQPVIQSVGTGTIPVGSMVQYAYRLLDTNGAESLFSPVSALYPLFNQDIYSIAFGDLEGSSYHQAFSRSVTYSISGIDTDYDVIEHIAIIYEDKDVPKIYKFNEQEVPASGSVTVTHTGSEDYIEIPLVVFNELSSGFDICKDIEAKDNRLIAANTRTTQFDIDFDARAYRFNNAAIALITDSNQGNIGIVGALPNWNIPEDHDAINPYNDESDPNWLAANQYKFQTDGTTLGGEGPNIKYEFISTEAPGNFNVTHPSTPDHVEVNKWLINDGDEDNATTNPDGSLQTIERSSQFKNFAGSYFHSYFKGYARGEVYRFGIVFYSKKGSTSFVKWIGDIRMPEPSDGYRISDTISNYAYVYSLGIKFTVDVSSIADEISGYSIVRVLRTEADKTKLGTGSLMLYDIQDDSYDTSLIHRYEGGAGAGTPYPLTDDTDINGSTSNSNFHLNDRPGFSTVHLSFPSTRGITNLISPLGQFASTNGYTFKTGDYIKTYGYYLTNPIAYYVDGTTSYGFYYKTQNFQAMDHSPEYFEIRNAAILKEGEYVASNSGVIASSPEATPNNLINASYSRNAGSDREVPFGLGSPKHTIILKENPTQVHAIAASSMDWYAGGDYSALTFTAETGEDVYMKEVAYCRYLPSQYGGSTYEDRSTNRYISTNHFQAINDITGTSHEPIVYGGDITVNYFDDEHIQFYINKETAFQEPYLDPVTHKLSVAVVCPCESTVNTEFRIGRHWAADRDPSNMLAYESNSYSYNRVYTQENNVCEKYFAQDFLSNFVEEQPTRIWASENKINGELIDSWRIFRANNSTEVDGVYGPINRIINFQDKLHFFQDSGFGIAAINERSIVNDESGVEIVLGNGGVLDDYGYISRKTGSFHQFSVESTENGLYFYDARLKKFYRYAQGPMPLSDIKGMSSFFDKAISGSIVNTDITLRENGDNEPIGVHAIPDYRYNRILFTFLNAKQPKGSRNDTSSVITYLPGDLVLIGTTYYNVVSGFSLLPGNSITVPSPALEAYPADYINGFTISYNELTDSFEAFYGYIPSLYLNYGRRLISVDPYNKDAVYEHNVGEYCSYYGREPEESEIILLSAPNASITKVFNNLEFQSEIIGAGVDIYNETISSYRVYNEYQDTGLIPLTVNNNVKRKMREWRITIDRDSSDNKSRIRNPYTFIKIGYNNNNDKRLILHDVIVSFTMAPR